LAPLARPLLRSRLLAVAARLSAVACAASLGGGCLWWPDIEERPDVSFPPVIDRSGVTTPSPERIVDLTTVNTAFSVEGAVSDLDTPLEELEYAWYLSYPDFTQPRNAAFTGSPSIKLNACYFSEVGGELYPTGSTHLLELIVTDGHINFDAEQGRSVTGGYAYISWTVRSQVSCQ
jgi:hypothetical protein